MCVFRAPSVPQDNSAEIARQREAQRQADIRAGRDRIDTTFAERFNDPFYAEREQSYMGYYTPQLEDQYQDAYRKLVLGLSRSGNLNSGSGARQLGDLKEAYAREQGALSSRALDSVNTLKSNVENARSDLYQQNTAAADPSAAAASALNRAGVLAAPAAYSPLGDLFAGFINNAATAVSAEKAGYRGWNTGLFNNTPTRERVVS